MESSLTMKKKAHRQYSPVGSPAGFSKHNGIPDGGTLMPVNIKQVLDSWQNRNSSYITINSSPAPTIKVIGKVLERTCDEYRASFRIEDCSGTIEASIWLTWCTNEFDNVKEGAYVTAVGRVNLDGNIPELQCYVCRPIKNFNDITHHHLSVIATHIDLIDKAEKQRTHGFEVRSIKYNKRTESGQSYDKKDVLALPGTNPAIELKKPKLEKPTQENKVCTIRNERHNSIPLETAHDDIMEILRGHSTEFGLEGVHINYICKALNLAEEGVRKHITHLASAGELYTTIDGDHYAPT